MHSTCQISLAAGMERSAVSGLFFECHRPRPAGSRRRFGWRIGEFLGRSRRGAWHWYISSQGGFYLCIQRSACVVCLCRRMKIDTEDRRISRYYNNRTIGPDGLQTPPVSLVSTATHRGGFVRRGQLRHTIFGRATLAGKIGLDSSVVGYFAEKELWHVEDSAQSSVSPREARCVRGFVRPEQNVLGARDLHGRPNPPSESGGSRGVGPKTINPRGPSRPGRCHNIPGRREIPWPRNNRPHTSNQTLPRPLDLSRLIFQSNLARFPQDGAAFRWP